MADRDKPSDIDKLLAEVDHTLAASRRVPAAREPAPVEAPRPGLTARARSAAVAGAVTAVVVWVVFAALPFLGATSGAVGAFLATFVAVLVLRRR